MEQKHKEKIRAKMIGRIITWGDKISIANKNMGKTLLNLGCGVELQAGFINIDLYPLEDLKAKKGVLNKAVVRGKYIQADVRKLPFKDNYADYILASEILEHIPLQDLNNTLREWVRVLKKGGRMVITCPDFNEVALEWLNTPFDPVRYGDMAQVIYGSQVAEGEVHRSPITPAFFHYYLGSMGLKDGKIAMYKKGHETIDYPGKRKKKDEVYRCGVVHVDLIK
jgi:SAM-dependent methyltransferase